MFLNILRKTPLIVSFLINIVVACNLSLSLLKKRFQHWLFPDSYLKFLAATSKTWTQTLKNLGHEKLDPEKPGLRKTWFMKNAGNSWIQKKD